MAADKKKRDKHFPNVGLDNPFRRLFYPPERLIGPFISKGQRVADLGCGPGFFTLAMADIVGPEGMVYAVDSNPKCIRAVEKKAGKRGYRNIEAHATSAHELGFIDDGSIDFIFAYGLLCSMAPQYHEDAVKEIKRILKPTGRAYLTAAQGSIGYMEREEWEGILDGFKVEERADDSKPRADFKALVSLKDG
jgi:ubiquinone/menaquinone biosynthesis C-methylase UbiE